MVMSTIADPRVPNCSKHYPGSFFGNLVQLGFVLRVDSFVFGFEQLKELFYELVEDQGVFFYCNSLAQPIHPFTFFGCHG